MMNHIFFDAAISASALKFGEFRLKSGRISPYFFNAGLFNSGKTLYQLAECYVQKIMQEKVAFDVVFGPAYKGIALAALVASILFSKYNIEVGFCYNRKEVKDHGEGGILVGANITGKRVLIIDDVITAGTAIKEAINVIYAQNGHIVGVCVALDRQEIAPGQNVSAIQSLTETYRFPIYAVATLRDLIEYIQVKGQIEETLLIRMKSYQKNYGVT
ncbi:orotate phosphoribosyltransferase [Fastidiosibacter lacustris]|uniref:orotate phosphoribosyltransferase n=1 Tax=Fastidiosibacter lacustris TaxID=2056695 RepID=UPI000E352682|nr:orotate phosphoribosyltransferase [Fastidiosibacter lacustris]